MKELIFLRHGHALSCREAGVAGDSLRPLSERGTADAADSARRLKDSGFSPRLIIASPYRRAAMTADIAAEIFPAAARLSCDGLSDGDADAVIRLIRATEVPDGGGLLVVGHQPLLGALAGFFSGDGELHLSPAGYARLACPAGPFAPGPSNELKELHTPPGGAF